MHMHCMTACVQACRPSAWCMPQAAALTTTMHQAASCCELCALRDVSDMVCTAGIAASHGKVSRKLNHLLTRDGTPLQEVCC